MATETDQNEEWGWGRRPNIFFLKYNGWKFFKLDENYKLTDPKSSQTPRRTNKSIPRQGKKKEHTKAHHNQIAKNPRKRENLINS